MNNPCRYVGCTSEATTSLEAAGEDGFLTDVAACCEPCKKKFLEGWDRMTADAAALRDQGIPKEELDSIMCGRVDRGDY